MGSQIVTLVEEIGIVVYDSNHRSDHIQEMMQELKSQLLPLFDKLPKLQICCPQTSLPYSNHALFALATFQVIAQGGDPCNVRFNPQKMRDHLRLVNEQTSKANLLFPFSPFDASTQKKNKRSPWLGKIVDFVEYVDEPWNDEDPYNDGLFTTMLTQRNLVSDLEVSNVIKKRQKGKKKR